jgi:hypothetical protein
VRNTSRPAISRTAVAVIVVAAVVLVVAGAVIAVSAAFPHLHWVHLLRRLL